MTEKKSGGRAGSKGVEPAGLNTALGVGVYRKALDLVGQRFSIPQLEDMEDWRGKRAMIFAPHQDDDVLGCGGTIRRLLDVKAKVRVVYLTDGSRGSAKEDLSLAGRRKLEAMEGLAVLGCKEHDFLGFEDGRLLLGPDTLGAVKERIISFRPDAVFVTNPLDGPNDHVMASAIVSEALRHYKGDVQCFNYEIWNPVMPNRLVDISDVMGMKEEAIRKHRSQMEVVDYVHRFRGLNAYRSIYASGTEYCEAFLKLGREDQVRMIDGLLPAVVAATKGLDG